MSAEISKLLSTRRLAFMKRQKHKHNINNFTRLCKHREKWKEMKTFHIQIFKKFCCFLVMNTNLTRADDNDDSQSNQRIRAYKHLCHRFGITLQPDDTTIVKKFIHFVVKTKKQNQHTNKSNGQNTTKTSY